MRFALLALLITACCSSGTAFFAPAAFAGLATLRSVQSTTPASSSSLRGGCPSTTMSVTVPTLFDVPVSNNGARCRIIIYKKGLTESDVVSNKADNGTNSSGPLDFFLSFPTTPNQAGRLVLAASLLIKLCRCEHLTGTFWRLLAGRQVPF